MKAGLLMGLESPSARAERMARMVQIWGAVPPIDETVARIEAVTLAGAARLRRRHGDGGPGRAGALRPVKARAPPCGAAGPTGGMMLALRRKLRLETERLTLRPPVHADYTPWTSLRRESARFPGPMGAGLGRGSPLAARLHQPRLLGVALRLDGHGTAAVPRSDARTRCLWGPITLDNIRRGPAQAGTLGYWVGERFARRGYMSEAITAVVHHAFEPMGLSRIEAACLPENVASRGLLERSGFKYEGVAQSYLQINGRWRTHVLYASLRADRRGRTSVG